MNDGVCTWTKLPPKQPIIPSWATSGHTSFRYPIIKICHLEMYFRFHPALFPTATFCILWRAANVRRVMATLYAESPFTKWRLIPINVPSQSSFSSLYVLHVLQFYVPWQSSKSSLAQEKYCIAPRWCRWPHGSVHFSWEQFNTRYSVNDYLIVSDKCTWFPIGFSTMWCYLSNGNDDRIDYWE